MSKRTVLFDVDGVLIHSIFHPDPSRHRPWDRHLFEDLGIEPAKFKAFFGPDWRDIVMGRKSLIVALDEFLPTIGYKGSSLDLIAYWFSRDTEVNLPLLRLIGRLREAGDVRLFMATNQEPLRAQHLWTDLKLGHLFDDMFYAARLGAAKPDRTFFERVAQRLGKQEQVPLFFDDGVKIVEAARTFGWEAVLYNDLSDFTNHPFIAERMQKIPA